MNEFPDVVTWSAPAFILLLILERISYWLHPDDDELGYDRKDAITSISMGVGSVVTNVLWGAVSAAGTSAIYALTPLRVPTTWWTVAIFMIAWDLCFYWAHRAHHRVRLLWATHVVHHSSQRFNLSTALRQPWTAATSWIFFLPMVALGAHPLAVAFCGGVNLIYQFVLHTERIDKLPRWYEFVLNTPSHHRVHHASQGGYLDRNYGGVLIVWDRIFGTFAAETTRPVYGLTTNIDTYNPLRVALHEYAAIGRDLRAARSWRARLGHLVYSPGWRPGL